MGLESSIHPRSLVVSVLYARRASTGTLRQQLDNYHSLYSGLADVKLAAQILSKILKADRFELVPSTAVMISIQSLLAALLAIHQALAYVTIPVAPVGTAPPLPPGGPQV